MVSAKAITYGDKKSFALADVTEDTIPTAIQIFGSEPDTMADAAMALMRFSPPSIDINMGCPVPKITSNGEGSALMLNPSLAGRIVRAVSDAINIPVTVKIRSGWDENSLNAPDIAAICEQNGAKAVAVHARTKKQGYSGNADWNMIALVKKSVSIPVMGNGDIHNGADALRMLEETQCDGVMIGRGAYGNPFIFEQIDCTLKGKHYTLPSENEKKDMIMKHISLLKQLKGEYIACRELRGHLTRYITGMDGAAKARLMINNSQSCDELREILNVLF